MGQIHHDRQSSLGQGSSQAPRQRRCLLKGCEQFFKPDDHQGRYCGAACQNAADRRRRWSADQTWRKTESGRECRRQQSCRYRQRVRERREAEQAAAEEVAAEEVAPAECEGECPTDASEKCSVPVRAATSCSFLPGLAPSALLFVLVP